MMLKDLLLQYSGKKIFHMLNPGNRGDSLINQGSKYLLADCGVDAWGIWYPDNVSGEVLFVNGAGGFCKPHHDNVFRINFYLNKFDQIYILPASFEVDCLEVKNFLENSAVQKKVTIFCREKYSYDQVSKIYPQDKVFLDQDLAFYFNWDGVKRTKGRGRLNAFRMDSEALKERNIPKGNCDLSKDSWSRPHHNWRFFDMTRCLNYRLKLPLYSMIEEQRCRGFINDINRYAEVHTDRAHVAIAAAMLGKDVHIYSNNYHKLRGIYEYSLAHLSNVKFIEGGNGNLL